MIVVTIAVCLGVLGAAVMAVRGPFRVAVATFISALEGIAAELRANSVDAQGDLERRLVGLEEDIDRLPKKWQDIADEAERHYQRARHHVRRVKTELEARGYTDPEIDQLEGELRLINGDGSGEEEVPAVHSELEGHTPTSPPAVEDWRAVANRRKFGGN